MNDKTRSPSNGQCCEGCAHWRRLAGRYDKSLHVCHFILDTGHRRGGTVENCTKRTIIGRASA